MLNAPTWKIPERARKRPALTRLRVVPMVDALHIEYAWF